MTEIEKIDFVFNYLNKKGKINNLEMVFLHEAPTPLPRAERRKLYSTIINTGFVNVLDHSISPDNAIEMNGAGYKMMEKHGSYSAYCEAKEKAQKEEKQEIERAEKVAVKWNRRNLLLTVIGIIISLIFGLLAILSR